MSLAGLRDMSVIETPPKDRLAIQTIVAPFTEALVRRGVMEELDRGGQVFLVHNRVESIDSIAELVTRLVPKARVVSRSRPDGRKRTRKSDAEVHSRRSGRPRLSTTIIENGLDIPRANTLLVNRADRFGLSELYQLRGRVGRSNQRAYAYTAIPPGVVSTPLAQRRLSALPGIQRSWRRFSNRRTRPGVARRRQSPWPRAARTHRRRRLRHVLPNARARRLERKGESASPERRATLNLGLDIRIPPDYIPSENLRLRTYKRIAGRHVDAERVAKPCTANWPTVSDRLRPPSNNLLDYAVLKALAEKMLVATIDRKQDQIAIKFYDDTPLGPERREIGAKTPRNAPRSHGSTLVRLER